MELTKFNESISKSQRPMVVDFWAPWCAPCRAVKPTLEKLGREYEGRVDFWQINADESPEVLRSLRVYSIPTLIAYRDGKETARYVGAKSPQQLQSLFETLATGGVPVRPTMATSSRVLRLIAGTLLAVAGLSYSSWVLIALGAIVMFSAVHDRCPIWRAVTGQLAKLTGRA